MRRSPRRPHRSTRAALLLTALLAGAAGCAPDAEPDEQAPQWRVGRIGERELAEDEFDRFLLRDAGLERAQLDPAAQERLYEELLAEVLLARAARRVGLAADEEALAEERARLEALAGDVPSGQLEREAERHLLARLYEERVLAPEAAVSSDEVEAALGEAERRARRRDHAVFRQVVVDSPEAARQAHRRITRGGESFEAVARDVSVGADRGALQQRDLGELPEKATEVLRRLPEGSVSRPVEIDGMVYLFQLDALNWNPDPERVQERERVRGRLASERYETVRARRLVELAALEGIPAPPAWTNAAGEETTP
jgi:parvulin-like peptidyl-prolyl isomerase